MITSASKERLEKAKDAVLALFKEQNIQVAFDCEIRYRLENQFPHDVTGFAIRDLETNKLLVKTGLPGRQGASRLPIQFYKLPDSDYKQIIPLMHEKLHLETFIIGVAYEMGKHAESAWWRAFKRNNWETYPSTEDEPLGINEYQGRTCSTGHDIDFVAQKDGIEYGVEVKNGLNYPDDLLWKLTVAAELDTVPLIIARWLNPGQVPVISNLGGAGPIYYKDAIYSKTYSDLITQTKQVLGTPIEVRDEVDDNYFALKVNPIHTKTQATITETKRRLQAFLSTGRYNPQIRRIFEG